MSKHRIGFGVVVACMSAFVGSLATPQVSLAALNDGSCTNAQAARVVTRHQLLVDGKLVPYTATAGFIEVTAPDQSSKACVFYTSYVLNDGENADQRPVTFAFNGGPGSASLWLHLGLMGPKRVDMGVDGLEPPNGPGLVDNASTPLKFTDVVMIDPVATGFSHTENHVSNDKFFGVRNDYMSIAAFIENYLIAYNRWRSPKYILGESYGGIRASLLARHLQSDLGIGVTGIVLISPALSDATFFGSPDNNVPYWTYFPTYATTAWFHHKIAASMRGLSAPQVFEQAARFADTVYRDALDRGNSLSGQQIDGVAQQIADFTGFSKEYVLEHDLKIADKDIFKGLMSDEQEFVGRYDSRYVQSAIGDSHYVDPSDNAVTLPFTAAINEYLRNDLAVNLAVPYQDMAGFTSWPSESPSSGDGWGDVMVDLAQALSDNPNLHVMIASGYFDLACPMGTVAYEIAQMPGGPELASRVHQNRYFGGHMMYINPSALQQLSSDFARFVGETKTLQ